MLKKPGRSTDGEWTLMRRHPEAGARILDAIPFLDRASTSSCTTTSAGTAAATRTAWAGTRSRSGRGSSPSPTRSTRSRATAPTGSGRSLDEAIDEILARAGTQFDPECAAALADLDAGAVRELVVTGA